jgi:hypothetical protein
MFLDSVETRVANLVIDKNDDTKTGTNVVVHIMGTLPTLDMSEDMITDQMIMGSAYTSGDIGDEINKLSDEKYIDEETGTQLDRFLFITGSASSISGNKIRVYYDVKYNDFIVIPELKYILQQHKGCVYETRGYRVGGGGGDQHDVSDLILPTNTRFALPTPEVDVDSKHVFIKNHGLSNIAENDFFITLTDEYRVGDKKLAPLGLLVIDTATLFADGIKLPVHAAYQSMLNSYSIKYVGIVTPSKLYIPITF